MSSFKNFIKNHSFATAAVAFLALTSYISCAKMYEDHQHELANQEYAEQLFASVVLDDSYDVFECEDRVIDTTELMRTCMSSQLGAVISPMHVDLSLPGCTQVNYLLRYTDDLGKTHRKIVTKTLNAYDTTPPVIDLEAKTVELWEGDDFDASDYIKVTDTVDGVIQKADEEANGKYTITSNVDTGEAGTYIVKVKAKDAAGNTNTDSFEVAVFKKPVQQVQQVQQSQSYSGSGYSSGGGYTPVYYGPGSTNFDASYWVASGNSQEIVDAGGIAYLGDDYYHHNTSDFLSNFWNTSAGDTVTLNGINYTCTGISHGYVNDDNTAIYTDGGYCVTWDGNPDVVTCDGAPGTNQRWIMHLEPND